ncbi:MAG: hypothetical protein NVS2B9_17990 [Myxococcales bacterium]
MYRILIAPLARKLLRTLPDPLLSRVGHVVGKAADEAGLGQARAAASARARTARLEIEGLALTCAIDPARHTLTVRRIAPA